jgi:hypothetical protein
MPNGTRVRFHSQVPGNTGEIIGHSGVVQNNILTGWVYIIVPFGMRWNEHIMETIERPDHQVEKI